MKIIAIINKNDVVEYFYDRIRKIADSDVSAIIFREKNVSEAEYYEMAEKIKEICDEYEKKLILHNFIDMHNIQKCNTGSIHLPFDKFVEMNENVREMYDIIGVSTHTVEEALECERLGASYITASHIFETKCKEGLEPRGLKYLKAACDAVKIPVYALGGIDASNASLCIDNGAAGVCVMSGIMKCDDVKKYVKMLKEK